MLVHDDVAIIINTVTNTYDSYISTSGINKIIPDDCRADYEIAYGSTSIGMAALVNCYAVGSDFGLKFSLNV